MFISWTATSCAVCGSESALLVDTGKLLNFIVAAFGELLCLAREVGLLVSVCELTDTYSPAAIDMAPATRPANPAITTAWCAAPAAATPTRMDAVETMPVIGAQHRRAQPADAVDEMGFGVQPAHHATR